MVEMCFVEYCNKTQTNRNKVDWKEKADKQENKKTPSSHLDEVFINSGMR